MLVSEKNTNPEKTEFQQNNIRVLFEFPSVIEGTLIHKIQLEQLLSSILTQQNESHTLIQKKRVTLSESITIVKRRVIPRESGTVGKRGDTQKGGLIQ